jgi:hypothetical protein
MSNRKFRFAGVSKRDGEFHLRASNREIYDQILKRDKDTHITIVKLAKPMTKEEIRAALVRRKEFKSPAILKVLSRDDEVVVVKATKKKTAARRKPAASTETASAAA